MRDCELRSKRTCALVPGRRPASRFQMHAALGTGRLCRSCYGASKSPVTMKFQHVNKIKELKDALVTSGFITLAQQAKALGLARSTTWTILTSTHKSSGLSAATINCMLRSPHLPSIVQIRIVEYIKEKSAGLYGHSELQRRRFIAGLSGLQIGRTRSAPRQRNGRIVL